MLIPPGYASVSVEEICQPQFEDLELDIPGGDGERTLKDAVHGIILWPKCYIIIPQTEGSIPPIDPPQSRPSSSLRSSSRPSRSPRSLSTQEPLFNSGGASSSHDIDINPESPPKKQKKPMAAKQAPSKAQKNTAAPQKKPPNHESTSEKPPNYQSISEKTVKPSQKKPPQKKPPSHESTTEKTVGAQSSNPVQPPKPPTIKKMVEAISKRRLAWETTEEEGKTTIGAQHVHEFSAI
jgi:hypothetical protein